MRKEFRLDAFKSFVVSFVIFIFIVLWIIPISLLVGLISVKNLATIIPALQDALNKHPKAAQAATSLLPYVPSFLLPEGYFFS